MRNAAGRLRLMPLLVGVAFLAFAVRAGELFYGFGHAGEAFAQGAQAEVTDAEAPPMPAEGGGNEKAAAPGDNETVAGDSGDDGGERSEKTSAPQMPVSPSTFSKAEGEKVEWQDATEAEFAYSAVREDLYKDLAKRREELDKRDQELAMREALLEAAERELDQKLRELTSVKEEIQGLLNKQSEEEQARLASLVKIYEGMKAKDAARIFNTLDMDVLITVFSRMSERKSAPILAEMEPERAQTVTILLAQQRQMPGAVMP